MTGERSVAFSPRIRVKTALSRGLGMTIVAEGAETDEQHQQLRMEGCADVAA